MKRLFLLCALALYAFTPSSNAVAETFQFSFTGTLFSGSGYMDATEIGSTDKYKITSVFDGSVDAIGIGVSDINGILAKKTFQKNDNILIYPGTPGINGAKFFNAGGVSFSLDNGNYVNLNDTLFFENAVGSAFGINFTEFDKVSVNPSSGDPSLTPAPEPGSFVLLGTGLCSALGLVRRKIRIA